MNEAEKDKKNCWEKFNKDKKCMKEWTFTDKWEKESLQDKERGRKDCHRRRTSRKAKREDKN